MKHVTECVQEPFLIPLLITDEKYQKKARYCNHRKNIQSFYCSVMKKTDKYFSRNVLFELMSILDIRFIADDDFDVL